MDYRTLRNQQALLGASQSNGAAATLVREDTPKSGVQSRGASRAPNTENINHVLAEIAGVPVIHVPTWKGASSNGGFDWGTTEADKSKFFTQTVYAGGKKAGLSEEDGHALVDVLRSEKHMGTPLLEKIVRDWDKVEGHSALPVIKDDRVMACLVIAPTLPGEMNKAGSYDAELFDLVDSRLKPERKQADKKWGNYFTFAHEAAHCQQDFVGVRQRMDRALAESLKIAEDDFLGRDKNNRDFMRARQDAEIMADRGALKKFNAQPDFQLSVSHARVIAAFESADLEHMTFPSLDHDYMSQNQTPEAKFLASIHVPQERATDAQLSVIYVYTLNGRKAEPFMSKILGREPEQHEARYMEFTKALANSKIEDKDARNLMQRYNMAYEYFKPNSAQTMRDGMQKDQGWKHSSKDADAENKKKYSPPKPAF